MVKLNQPEEKSSDDATDLKLIEDDWVIVKKQKINILMPPLPGSSDPIACKPSSDQIQVAVSRELDNTASDHPAEKVLEEQFDLGNDKPTSATMEEDIPPSEKSHNPSNDAVPKMGDVPKTDKPTRDHHGVRTVKQWRPSPGESKLNNGSVLLSKMMKASILERKLLRAGGLSRWLTSLGLKDFIRIFQARNISKFQLVNLSMKKLEEMGIHAVGPRRKLIHAIECVCHPYCFQAL